MRVLTYKNATIAANKEEASIPLARISLFVSPLVIKAEINFK